MKTKFEIGFHTILDQQQEEKKDNLENETKPNVGNTRVKQRFNQ